MLDLDLIRSNFDLKKRPLDVDANHRELNLGINRSPQSCHRCHHYHYHPLPATSQCHCPEKPPSNLLDSRKAIPMESIAKQPFDSITSCCPFDSITSCCRSCKCHHNGAKCQPPMCQRNKQRVSTLPSRELQLGHGFAVTRSPGIVRSLEVQLSHSSQLDIARRKASDPLVSRARCRVISFAMSCRLVLLVASWSP